MRGWAEPEPPVLGSAHPTAPSSPEKGLLGPEQHSINTVCFVLFFSSLVVRVVCVGLVGLMLWG